MPQFPLQKDVNFKRFWIAWCGRHEIFTRVSYSFLLKTILILFTVHYVQPQGMKQDGSKTAMAHPLPFSRKLISPAFFGEVCSYRTQFMIGCMWQNIVTLVKWYITNMEGRWREFIGLWRQYESPSIDYSNGYRKRTHLTPFARFFQYSIIIYKLNNFRNYFNKQTMVHIY